MVDGRVISPEDIQGLLQRLWPKLDFRPDGCWVFTLGLSYGYGEVSLNHKKYFAHRLTYQAFNGPVPEGKELDHLCRNKACCNPAHLEAVSHRENVMRGKSPFAVMARWTHCPRGHEFTQRNTYRRRNGTRMCRECNNLLRRKDYVQGMIERARSTTKGV